ncbi:RagB/SusD family nutrient uptake outer membrane protein [Sanguibacteroides justesenii]|uniref:RagB/SusD family nutrient uptake outer membrane protein n=1 Tax=Sanguibacteroides justesenii TaxID=1547597 RepID=A0A0C3RB98_9PORP|nr:RagB/SusD family nutrient uptake outer membrane protein [Sanguibacteroides justesenii]KIO42971.1 hypothetical protein BA92_14030 [Sanguibacteroides justesenii]
MRKGFIILCIQIGLFCSCNSWLELEPANQISKGKLFSDEAGFQNALNGIYQKCGETSLYGKNLSWGALSLIAQDYDLDMINNNSDADMGEYEYESSYGLTIIDNIWSGLYNAIANCNLLLNEISSASPSLFALDTVAKNLIMGEAYALRAFCHLDLIRLFAPAPVKNDQAALVPYHETYPSVITKPLKTKDAIDKVIEDLLKAKDLVAYHDTIYNKTSMAYKASARFQGQYTPKGGAFYNKRGYRLNYCAIVGLLARAYLYKGDVDNALFYAKHFYDRFYNGNRWFAFNSSYDYSTSLNYKQKKYLEECLFAFYNGDLLEAIENYCAGSGYYSSSLQLADYDGIFAEDMDDYRTNLIDPIEHDIYKYRRVNNYQRDNVEGTAIPVLRLSEMYYILMECNFLKGNTTECLRLLKEFRSKKGSKRSITSVGDIRSLYDILINDARREFIGEGQLFFMYKRLNRNILVKNGEITASEERMTFKVPDSQNFY